MSQKSPTTFIYSKEHLFGYTSNWYENLPACPCTYTEAEQLGETTNPKGEWLICGAASKKYHYGATYEIRWLPLKKGEPGQQCTYDENGDLITSGIAAGTPDKVSPRACSFGIKGLLNIKYILQHKKADVDTWKQKPCIEYLDHWPSNNVNNCEENTVTAISHMKKLVGNLTCEEITELFKIVDQNNADSLLIAYFHNDLNNKIINLNEQIVTMLRRLDCENGDSDKCRIINKAIKNLLG